MGTIVLTYKTCKMGAVLAMLLFPEPCTSIERSKLKQKHVVTLPTILHQVITKEDIGSRRVLVIGDVHGCLEELQELLTSNNITAENTVIIFCGDIVNKGPYNLETLRYVRQLGAYVTRGNHDEHVLEQVAFLKMDLAPGEEVPGRATILQNKPYAQWMRNLEAEDVEYLAELPYTVSLPALSAIIVHAGLNPFKPLSMQHPADMTLMRNIVNGDFQPCPSEKVDSGLAWAAYWNGPEHVYYGHDARRGLQQRRFSTGLDTGVLYGGKLTGVFIHPHKQFISVNAKKKHKDPLKT